MLYINNDLLRFDFSSFFSFLFGILFGVSLAFLFYIVFIFIGFSKKKRIIKSKENVSPDILKNYIAISLQTLDDSKTKGIKRLEYSINLCKNITVDMAESFFPKSKYPLCELTISESLDLMNYISKRVNELLDVPGIKLLKNVKLVSIIKSQEIKDKLDDNFIYRNSKRYKFNNALKSTVKILNFLNPLWWSKKLIINTSVNILLKKFSSVLVTITAEEAYKIYSKKVFLDESIVKEEIKNAQVSLEKSLEEINESYQNLVSMEEV